MNSARRSAGSFFFLLTVIVGISIFLVGCASSSSAAHWIVLFEGKGTDAFRGFRTKEFPSSSWTVQQGALRSVPGRGVDLITREKFTDFDLELDWAVSKGANSGILYGVSEETSETYWSGPEMQVNDDTNHSDGETPKYSAGALYDLIAPNASKKLNPTGEWNHARIVSRKGHVEHWLNGAKILEYEWSGAETLGLIAQSKFKTAPDFMKHREGYVALQHHGAEVRYRNIRIRRL
jgi:hypothetical protein